MHTHELTYAETEQRMIKSMIFSARSGVGQLGDPPSQLHHGHLCPLRPPGHHCPVSITPVQPPGHWLTGLILTDIKTEFWNTLVFVGFRFIYFFIRQNLAIISSPILLGVLLSQTATSESLIFFCLFQTKLTHCLRWVSCRWSVLY